MKKDLKPGISIIVLNYNGKQFLFDCFSSMQKLNYPNYEVIMVDDCSVDDSIAYVKKNFPEVKVIKNERNSGAPVSFNKAIRLAKNDYLVKVDNDVIVDKNWLDEMVRTLQSDSKIGLVGSLILNYGENDIQDIGGNIDRFGYQMNYLTLDGVPKKDEKVKEVFYVSGCSMLFKKNLFEKIGGFDEKFFLYKDDLDLCWRMKMLGYKIVINLNSIIYHKSGVTVGGQIVLDQKGKYHTSAKKRFFGERNTLRALLKNYSLLSLVKVLPIYFLLILAEIILFTILCKFKVVQSYLKSIWWNFQLFPDTLNERRKIQALRSITDKEVTKNTIKGSSKINYLRTIGVPEFG